jgi:hypothetical protein
MTDRDIPHGKLVSQEENDLFTKSAEKACEDIHNLFTLGDQPVR